MLSPRFAAVAVLACMSVTAVAAPPTDNPVTRYELAWTDEIKWDNVVDVSAEPGDTIMQKLASAQKALVVKGGGVAYFPAGTYQLADTIELQAGVVLRGATPTGVTDAKDAKYAPPTVFEFPAYKPSFEGEGTPVDTAFKGIHLTDFTNAANVGVVNIQINHGHIEYGQSVEHKAGRNRLVYGCVIRNAAILDGGVPAAFQHRWQRWTARHHGALHVYCDENMLLANNRLPESDGSFVMPAAKLNKSQKDKTIVEADIRFDYDFRPGIYANIENLGTSGVGEHFTPEQAPWGFRKGLVIRDNYIFCTASPGILFTGDGTICSFNVIRYKEGVKRYTVGGVYCGHFTANIRAIEARGWRWTVEGNDYEVHRNEGIITGIGADGEGIMHESHNNSTVKDSKLINNTGNAYLCFWRLPVDGLLIKGNHISVSNPLWGAICVLGERKGARPDERFEVRNVTIEDNTTEKSGIMVTGKGAEIVIRNNRHVGEEGNFLRNYAGAETVEGNEGYTLDIPKPEAPAAKNGN